MKLQGLVWVEDDRIVGNLTIIPFHEGSRLLHLIANVAVHPDFRQQGIGRALTQSALDYARARGASAAWLHVRDDNSAAQHLYYSLGFVNRASRTSWQWEPRDGMPDQGQLNGSVRQPRLSDWGLERTWLLENYPPEVCWNLGFNPERLKTNLWSTLIRWLEGGPIIQWAAYRGGKLLGCLAWEPTTSHSDVLWAACPPETETDALPILLPHIVHALEGKRPLSVNYPVGRAVEAFQSANFHSLHTLLWMEVRLKL